MVMNMYALLESGPKTQAQIENSFGGNLCRCTGYRPILTAFKTLASDADPKNKIEDIEDAKPCKKSKCVDVCTRNCKKAPVYFELGESKWIKVYTLSDLLNTLKTVGSKTYQLVGGNTARGVYWPNSFPEVNIDITSVGELTSSSVSDDSVILGANCSLTFTIQKFQEIASQKAQFSYLSKMADHIDLVAHVPVRNIGTIAGNLMTKHQHQEFPSDIFLILETADATLVIVDLEGNTTMVSPQDFLKLDMNKKVMKQIILNAYDSNIYSYTSYKIMPRAQNAHAMVNAGFLLRFVPYSIPKKVQTARIVYGGINPNFVHAKNAETVLKGKAIFDNSTLQAAFKALDAEIVPDWVLPDPKPEFRKQLAINLFYKYVLSIAPTTLLSLKNRSGGTILSRSVSKGTQQIYSNQSLYPLTQPMIKLEALAQTSGQAKYVLDIPDLPNQLHAILVQAKKVPGSTITSIDTQVALAQPGVVAFFSAKDIPGVNSFAVPNCFQNIVEEVFCSGTVKYYSQPVGILVAVDHETATIAANLVKISVTAPKEAPYINIRDVLSRNATSRVNHKTSFIPKGKGTDIKKVIKGETYVGGQYHFHMETQTCLVVPTEDGLNVFASTQWMDQVQGAISQVLNMPSQKISVIVRRLGGGFGAKVSRSALIASAAALAASKLNKPVRIWMNFNDNMDIIGKRFPCLCQYEVGVNSSGNIQYLKADIYSDVGVGGNESIELLIVGQFQNCYIGDYFGYDTYYVTTDNPANCFTRAPGNCEAVTCIESIMDHIAHELKLDPVSVRQANLDSKNNTILLNICKEIDQTDDIQARKSNITLYNQANRWKKKGLSLVPMRWDMDVVVSHMTLVSIYHLDGGVAVTHGGVEMGQGVNTKVAQVCAYKFGIPMEQVSVKPSYNVITPNNFPSGASLTSEGVVFALLKACDVLLDRIKPIKDKNPNASWKELIQLCYAANVNLSSNGFYAPTLPDVHNYPIFGCCALEVEVDILTGNHQVTRVDVIEDVGQSMSPLIDIGQLEGALVMGMGYQSTEELIYDTKTGRLTNDRTWNYKPFGAKDIPIDFRVKFPNNTFNPVGVLKSKAIAEPPLCLTVSLALAIRLAVGNARRDANATASTWYPIDGPSTVENTLLNTLNNYTQYTL
ncbi:xanthine dehydrogenase-like isoform X2 [Sitophilus oryzae]|nr:xanthine dehydrogenase-like isoform X2 [Sitophilus oryzae]